MSGIVTIIFAVLLLAAGICLIVKPTAALHAVGYTPREKVLRNRHA